MLLSSSGPSTTAKWKAPRTRVLLCPQPSLSAPPCASSFPGSAQTNPGSTWDGLSGALRDSLPRKEVIQPHLPVRLPCYDFTPITDPTLDACPPTGLAQRLQVLPTFVV